MSPDVLFAIGLTFALTAAVLGGWMLGRALRDEHLDDAYWQGHDDARAQAEEFIVWDFTDRETVQ